jgi:TetR/AcrR family transcriptional regulator
MCPTDETILDAALAVLAREGYGGATTKKIAEEAGINEVTLFRKFKSKENLIHEAKKLGLKRTLDNMDKTFRSIEGYDFEASVTALGKHLSDSVDKKTNMVMTAIVDMQKPACDTPGPHFSSATVEHLKNYFEEQIERGNMRDVDPEIAALGFFGFIFYLNFICKLKNQIPERNADRALEEFMDIFMNGVKAPVKRPA